MSAEGGTTGYIQHHLTNLAVCRQRQGLMAVCHRFLDFPFRYLLVSGVLGLVVFGF